MEGSATMYMRMPMSTSTLPIQGRCSVQEDKKISLKFPFTGIEFELPAKPVPGADCAFKIRGSKGDMLMTIDYVPQLQCFVGVGKQEEDEAVVIRFTFWGKDSPMSKLPAL